MDHLVDFLGTGTYFGDSYVSVPQNPLGASRVSEQTVDVQSEWDAFSGGLRHVGRSQVALTEGDKGRSGHSPQGRVRLGVDLEG